MSSIITPDYYETLELERGATQEEIKQAYRNLSLRFNPKKATDANKEFYTYKFHKIAEAYIVLSDPEKKGVYDNYGLDGLYKGIDKASGNFQGGFKYTGNAQEVFDNFMENTNPFGLIEEFQKMPEEYGSIFGTAFGGLYQLGAEENQPIIIVLKCSLEELYNGAFKEIKYMKNKLNFDGRTTELKEMSLNVEVLPGYGNDTVIRFEEQGHESPGKKNGDLIVKIQEIPHSKFKRVNKNDLIYTETLTLSQALNSVPVVLEHLDGRKIHVSMDEIISPSSVKLVENEGMPVCEMDNKVESVVFEKKKGNLYLRFNIVFPVYINAKRKERIIDLLEGEN